MYFNQNVLFTFGLCRKIRIFTQVKNIGGELVKKMIFGGLLVVAFLLCAVVLYRGSRTETYDLDFPEEGLQVWTDMEKAVGIWIRPEKLAHL